MSEHPAGPCRWCGSTAHWTGEHCSEVGAEITGGMLQWIPGTISDTVVERIGTDALADMWCNCGQDAIVFQEKVMAMIKHATGAKMSVYSGPHAENWNGKK